ncbi:MAG TPA: CsbD family protein [Stenomitos sp.]
MLQLNFIDGESKMSTDDRIKATAKNVEGKIQEAVGNVTGDPQAKTEGQAKQAESSARHGVEDVKDEVKKAVD